MSRRDARVRLPTRSVMSQPVFISYARDASRDKAEALHRALGERTAFLDTADIADGDAAHFGE